MTGKKREREGKRERDIDRERYINREREREFCNLLLVLAQVLKDRKRSRESE